MNEQPCKPARRIAARIAEETGCVAEVEQQIADLVHQEIRDYRPIDAFAQSLKGTLVRIIENSDPHAEVREIAEVIGIAVLTK
jgi:hypothetical protein